MRYRSARLLQHLKDEQEEQSVWEGVYIVYAEGSGLLERTTSINAVHAPSGTMKVAWHHQLLLTCLR